MSRVRAPSIAHFFNSEGVFPLSLIQAIILGIIQGLTEFFPVSSSAHLKLAKWMMGIEDGEGLIYFDLMCHAGTLLALLIFLRKDILEILKTPKKMGLYFLALIPLIPAYFFLKPLRILASEPCYLGYSLLFTSLLLFTASKKIAVSPTKKWGHVLCIGVMQSMALIPGVSRSGSTIAAARFCGWEWKEAAKFSFLLAIPTILGGEILETMKGHGASQVSGACYGAGFFASFLVGAVAVPFVFWIYENEKVRPIAWYCMGAGLFAWAVFNG